ncbi:hypothetical protein HK101_010603 [Irineochytrium annulatum]|nr:hypothetical protein HK101_010603 [Irineochytrium annulatum]
MVVGEVDDDMDDVELDAGADGDSDVSDEEDVDMVVHEPEEMDVDGDDDEDDDGEEDAGGPGDDGPGTRRPSSVEADATAMKTREELLTIRELMASLESDNIEVLHAVLSRFSKSLGRLVHGVVDHEVSGESDLFRAYIKASPECMELISIWQYQQEHAVARLETVILDVLANVITVTRFVGGARSIGTGVVRAIIRNHMRPLYRNLSSRKNALIQSTLRLLVAMSTQSSSTTRELQETFNFSMKSLPGLFKIRRKVAPQEENEGEEPAKPVRRTNRDDVRSLYIRFLLGFLMFGATPVKKAMLEIRDSISGIFKGTWEDSFEMIEFILSVLRKKVVDDSELTKTSKMTFFNNYVLEQITKLYGRSDVSIPSNVNTDGSKTVADLAHDFLLHLCTIPGTGVCHADTGWFRRSIITNFDLDTADSTPAESSGSGKKQPRLKNTVLLRWATFLKPTEMPLELTILLQLLRSCPELVQPYWSSLSLSFDPRISTRWILNMALAARLITLPLPELYYPAAVGGMDMRRPPEVIVMADNVLPKPLTRSILGRALQHASATVRNTAGLVLVLALEKVEALLARLEEVGALHDAAAAGKGIGDQWRSAARALTEEVWRRVPDVQIVLAFRTTLTASGTPAADKGKTSDAAAVLDVGVATVGGDDHRGEDEDVTPTVLRCTHLKLIGCYRRLFPAGVAESRFDLGRVVPVDLAAEPEEVRDLVLGLLRDFEGFKWWNRAAGSNLSHLSSLIKLHVRSSPGSGSHTLSRAAVITFLTTSFLFDGRQDEVDIWLQAFLFLRPEHQDPAIAWFDEAVAAGLRAPYRVISRMADLMAAASVTLHLSELERRCHEHTMACRLRGRVDAATGDGDPGFPFSATMVTALDGLVAILKKRGGQEGGDEACMGVVTAFHRVVSAIRRRTQGTEKYIGTLLATAVTSLGERMDGIDKIVRKDTWGPFDVFGALVITGRKPGLPVASNNVAKESRKAWQMVLKHSRTVDRDAYVALLLATHPIYLRLSIEDIVSHVTFEELLAAPLANYMALRHPTCGCGSLFDIYDKVQADTLAVLLSRVPFDAVLANVLTASVVSPAADSIVSDLLVGADATVLMESCRQIFLHLTEAGASRKTELCFKWVDTLVTEAIGRESGTANAIIEAVFGHPLFKEEFLRESKSPGDLVSGKRILFLSDGIDPDIIAVETIVSKILPLHYKEESSTWQEYLDRLSGRVMHEIWKQGKVDSSLLEVLRSLCPYYSGADLEVLLESAFNLDDPTFLTIIFKAASSKFCRISAKSFSRLQELVLKNPTLETLLDVLAAAVEGTMAPPSAGRSAGGFRVMAEDGAPANVDLLIAKSTLSAIVAGTRKRILSMLIERCPSVKRWVLSMNGPAIAVGIAGLLRLSATDVECRGAVEQWWTQSDEAKKMIGRLVAALGAGPGPSAREEAAIMIDLVQISREHFNARVAPSLQAPAITNAAGVVSALEVYLPVLAAAFTRSDELSDLIMFCLKPIETWFKLDDNSFESERIYGILDNITGALASSDGALPLQNHRKFVGGIASAGVKNHLGETRVMTFVRNLLLATFEKLADFPNSREATAVLDNLSTHPKLASILEGDNADTLGAKTELLRLLRTVLELNPRDHCRPTLLHILAPSYRGTTIAADRLILSIWHLYERAGGVSVAASIAGWGPRQDREDGDGFTGVGAGAGGVVTPTAAAEGIAPLDSAMVAATVAAFDVHAGVDVWVGAESDDASGAGGLYDVNFLLPLIGSALVRGGEVLDLGKLIEKNGLGFAVVMLSSEVVDMRRAGYLLLDAAFPLIERSESLKERNQVLLILNALRYAVESRDGIPPRIPSVIVHFVAQSLIIATKPEHFMYPLIFQFLLQRPVLDITDYRLYKRRHVIDLMEGALLSPLTDTVMRKLTFELLFQATTIHPVLSDLVARRGLLTFLFSCATSLRASFTNELYLALPRLTRAVVDGLPGCELRSMGESGQELCLRSIASIAAAIIREIRGFEIAWVVAAGGEEARWVCALVGEAVALIRSLAGRLVASGSGFVVVDGETIKILRRIISALSDVAGTGSAEELSNPPTCTRLSSVLGPASPTLVSGSRQAEMLQKPLQKATAWRYISPALIRRPRKEQNEEINTKIARKLEKRLHEVEETVKTLFKDIATPYPTTPVGGIPLSPSNSSFGPLSSFSTPSLPGGVPPSMSSRAMSSSSGSSSTMSPRMIFGAEDLLLDFVFPSSSARFAADENGNGRSIADIDRRWIDTIEDAFEFSNNVGVLDEGDSMDFTAAEEPTDLAFGMSDEEMDGLLKTFFEIARCDSIYVIPLPIVHEATFLLNLRSDTPPSRCLTYAMCALAAISGPARDGSYWPYHSFSTPDRQARSDEILGAAVANLNVEKPSVEICQALVIMMWSCAIDFVFRELSFNLWKRPAKVKPPSCYSLWCSVDPRTGEPTIPLYNLIGPAIAKPLDMGLMCLWIIDVVCSVSEFSIAAGFVTGNTINTSNEAPESNFANPLAPAVGASVAGENGDAGGLSAVDAEARFRLLDLELLSWEASLPAEISGASIFGSNVFRARYDAPGVGLELGPPLYQGIRLHLWQQSAVLQMHRARVMRALKGLGVTIAEGGVSEEEVLVKGLEEMSVKGGEEEAGRESLKRCFEACSKITGMLTKRITIVSPSFLMTDGEVSIGSVCGVNESRSVLEAGLFWLVVVVLWGKSGIEGGKMPPRVKLLVEEVLSQENAAEARHGLAVTMEVLRGVAKRRPRVRVMHKMLARLVDGAGIGTLEPIAL